MKGTAVLMYHAVVRNAAGADGADPHYAITPAAFREQLQALRRLRLEPTSVASLWAGTAQPSDRAVALTFDDGHVSHYEAVFPLLQEARARADFFVNPATVGRPGYVTWRQLREMADAGQSIQSHSHTHRYLSDLPEAELREELIRSRRTIEDRLGRPVRLLAPPGGRLGARARRAAEKAGYQIVCTSRPGCWRGRATVVPRFAVLRGTPLAQLERWAQGALLELLRQQSRYGLTYSAKRVLGNRVYDSVREQLLRIAAVGETS